MTRTETISQGTGPAAERDNEDNRHVSRLLRLTVRIALRLLLVAGVVAFIVYRMRFAPLSVESSPAATGSIASEVMGTGTLEARVTATISPKISGRLTQVLADQGDRVSAGQLLATLDDGDLKQQVAMARADLASLQAAVDRADAEIARALATSVQAGTHFQRQASMRKAEASSQFEVEKATESRDVAEAELNRSRVAKVEAQRNVIKSEETLRYYQERLADTRVLAPFDGLIVHRDREAGDIVVPGSSILQIISTEQMWVSAWVDETAISSLAVGQPARIVFRSEPDKPYPGAVTRLAPLADRETREFLVDLTVKDLPKTWAVGQRAEAHIQVAKKDQALLIPPGAIVWENGKPGVFVSDAGHARWRSITLGLRGTKGVEVTEGVAAGDLVVWMRDPKGEALAEGRAVTPVTP